MSEVQIIWVHLFADAEVATNTSCFVQRESVWKANAEAQGPLAY